MLLSRLPDHLYGRTYVRVFDQQTDELLIEVPSQTWEAIKAGKVACFDVLKINDRRKQLIIRTTGDSKRSIEELKKTLSLCHQKQADPREVTIRSASASVDYGVLITLRACAGNRFEEEVLKRVRAMHLRAASKKPSERGMLKRTPVPAAIAA